MSQAGCPITNVRYLVNRHHSRYGCLSLPNTAQRIPNQQPTATSTLTSLSANPSSPNAPAQPPSVSMSSTVTPLSSSNISRSTVRPVNLDNNLLMSSSVRHAPFMPSANSRLTNTPAQPRLVSLSSISTPLSSSSISRYTVRPVHLDNNPPMPSSVRRIPPVASDSQHR